MMLPTNAQRYTLTANDLQGETVMLNGRELKLDGDTLPKLRGVKVKAGPVALAPLSITYFAVPSAANKACG